MLRILFWYSQKMGISQMFEYTKIPIKSLSRACGIIRKKLAKLILRNQADEEELMGRGHTAVLIDCTWVTKKKRNRGGFRGRTTAGHQTCIIGMYELDLTTRKGTGRVILKTVVGERKEVMQKLIPKYCVPGATIWTDDHASYRWLHEGHSEKGRLSVLSGYIHSWVVHSKGQFADQEVSTNGVEALFSRVKKHFRLVGVTKISEGCYWPYLAEFLWYEKNLSAHALGGSNWRKQSFWLLCRALAASGRDRMMSKISGEAMKAENSLAKEFDALVPPALRTSNPPVPRAGLGAAPQAGAVLAPCVAPLAPQVAARAGAAPLWTLRNVALDPEKRDLDLSTDPEADEDEASEAHTDSSEVEVLWVIPAPRHATRGLKREACAAFAVPNGNLSDPNAPGPSRAIRARTAPNVTPDDVPTPTCEPSEPASQKIPRTRAATRAAAARTCARTVRNDDADDPVENVPTPAGEPSEPVSLLLRAGSAGS